MDLGDDCIAVGFGNGCDLKVKNRRVITLGNTYIIIRWIEESPWKS